MGVRVIINHVLTPNNLQYVYDSIKYYWENDFFNINILINYSAIWQDTDIVTFNFVINTNLAKKTMCKNAYINPKFKINIICESKKIFIDLAKRINKILQNYEIVK